MSKLGYVALVFIAIFATLLNSYYKGKIVLDNSYLTDTYLEKANSFISEQNKTIIDDGANHNVTKIIDGVTYSLFYEFVNFEQGEEKTDYYFYDKFVNSNGVTFATKSLKYINKTENAGLLNSVFIQEDNLSTLNGESLLLYKNDKWVREASVDLSNKGKYEMLIENDKQYCHFNVYNYGNTMATDAFTIIYYQDFIRVSVNKYYKLIFDFGDYVNTVEGDKDVSFNKSPIKMTLVHTYPVKANYNIKINIKRGNSVLIDKTIKQGVDINY